MTNERDFDRIARAFMAEGTTQLADRVLERSLADVHHTRQRRVLLRAPWRTPVMNSYVKFAVAAVVVVAVGALGIAVLRPDSSSAPVGGVPSANASPSTSVGPSASPQPSPTPTPAPSASPLSETFTSARHGISLTTPAGWSRRSATESATRDNWSSFLGFDSQYADVIYDPERQGELWLGISSLPLGDMNPERWPHNQFAAGECPSIDPVTVDGVEGRIGVDFHSTECSVAFVATDGRGYQIRLYDSNDEGAFDRAWFEELLATVQLAPEDAVN